MELRTTTSKRHVSCPSTASRFFLTIRNHLSSAAVLYSIDVGPFMFPTLSASAVINELSRFFPVGNSDGSHSVRSDPNGMEVPLLDGVVCDDDHFITLATAEAALMKEASRSGILPRETE